MAHETIIPHAEIKVNGEKLSVKVDHMLDPKDEDDGYTGCYRATINKYRTVYIELNADAIWIEIDHGASELTTALGNIIESYIE